VTDPRIADIDPRSVRGVRSGNALWPGLAAFTGLSFLVYLAVKAVSGAVAVDVGLYAQLAVSAALLAAGAVGLARARYFFLVVDTDSGARRIKGLTKSEQTAFAEALTPGDAPER
jgi:hypothetical protein